VSYRTEAGRRRLVVSAVLMVAAYSLQWAGILQIASNANRAVSTLVLTNYEWHLAESVLIGFSYVGQSIWMDMLSSSATTYAFVFAVVLWIAWRSLPRRAVTGLAAFGMLASFLLALPFAPGAYLISTVVPGGVGHMAAATSGVEEDAVAAVMPLGGGIPWLDISAWAAEAPEGAIEDRASSIADAFGMTALLELVSIFQTVMTILIGVGFWSTLLGLIVVTVSRGGTRLRNSAAGPSVPAS
jgi:hypothetical protein